MNIKVYVFVLSMFAMIIATVIGMIQHWSLLEILVFIGQLVLFMIVSLLSLLGLFWIGIKLFGDK